MPHSVFKPKRKRNGRRVEGRYWYGQYKLPGDEKYTRFSLKTTDKRVAVKRLNEMVVLEERRRAGLVAPEIQVAAAAATIADHLDEFIQYLKTANRSREYFRKIRERVSALIDACGWVHVRHVTADSFIAWRSQQSLSAKTLNSYQDAACGLLNWLKMTGRIDSNPLASVAKIDGRGKQTVERRAFTDDEMKRLIAVNRERGRIYLLATHTGLRKGELRALLWREIDLDRGVLCLRPEATKSRRADVLPLSPCAQSLLIDLHPRRAESKKVFGNGVPNHHTFHADLLRAGIERVDELGRKVDFHALRMTFITNLQRSGTSQRTAMALARHTDPRLTAFVYTDSTMLPLAEAVSTLPAYDAHIYAQESVAGSLAESQAGAAGPAGQPSNNSAEQGFSGVSTRRIATQEDSGREWSRGESNPRPEAARTMPLRV